MTQTTVSRMLMLGVVAVGLTVLPKINAEPSPKKEAKAEGLHLDRFSGHITAVDAEAKTITLKTDKGSKVVNVPDDCKFGGTSEKKRMTMTDLRVGDKVSVAYTKSGDQLTARQIGGIDLNNKLE